MDRVRLGSLIRLLVLGVCSLLLAEGWICAGLLFPLEVSGGSMAPKLLPRHYQFSCPCGRVFRVLLPDKIPVPEAVCPQCRRLLPLSRGQFTPGDRLLVLRTGVWNVPLHRWDIICYRDPEHPRNLAVKRLVGLPGEKLSLASGHLYVNAVPCPNSEKDLRRLLLPVAHWKGKLEAFPLGREASGTSCPSNTNSPEVPAEGGDGAQLQGSEQGFIGRRSSPNSGCKWQVVQLGQVADLLTDEIVENQWFAVGADLRHQVGCGRVEVEIRWLQGRREVFVCTRFPPHSFTLWLLPQEGRFWVFRASLEDWLESRQREPRQKNPLCTEYPLSRKAYFEFEDLSLGDTLRRWRKHALCLQHGSQSGEGTFLDIDTIHSAMNHLPPLSPRGFLGLWGGCCTAICCVSPCCGLLFKDRLHQRWGLLPEAAVPAASRIWWGSKAEYRTQEGKPQKTSPKSLDALEPLGDLLPAATGPLWGEHASHSGGDRCKIVWVFLPAEILLKVGRQNVRFAIQKISAPNSDRISGKGQAGLDVRACKEIARSTQGLAGTTSPAESDWGRPVVTIAMAKGGGEESIGYEVRVERMVYYFDFLSDISHSRRLLASFGKNLFAETDGLSLLSPSAEMNPRCEWMHSGNPYDDCINKDRNEFFLRDRSACGPSGLDAAGGDILSKPGSADLTNHNREWQLASDQFFLLGDNPHLSRDSRHFGPIELSPYHDLVGVAILKVCWRSFRLGPISFQVPWVLPADYIE
mgnify:CR=1 FL=1